MHDTDSLVATAIDLGNHTPNVAQARYDSEDDGTLVQVVLGALDEASDQPVDELSVRLYDAIDPDALNDLFDPTRTGPSRDHGRVSFGVGEFAVDVHATGHVFVRRTS